LFAEGNAEEICAEYILRMNDPKMPYFLEEIFEDDGFKRDFADAGNLVKSKFGKHLI